MCAWFDSKRFTSQLTVERIFETVVSETTHTSNSVLRMECPEKSGTGVSASVVRPVTHGLPLYDDDLPLFCIVAPGFFNFVIEPTITLVSLSSFSL